MPQHLRSLTLRHLVCGTRTKQGPEGLKLPGMPKAVHLNDWHGWALQVPWGQQIKDPPPSSTLKLGQPTVFFSLPVSPPTHSIPNPACLNYAMAEEPATTPLHSILVYILSDKNIHLFFNFSQNFSVISVQWFALKNKVFCIPYYFFVPPWNWSKCHIIIDL